MDTTAPVEPVWNTDPIMEVDKKEKKQPQVIGSGAQKNAFLYALLSILYSASQYDIFLTLCCVLLSGI